MNLNPLSSPARINYVQAIILTSGQVVATDSQPPDINPHLLAASRLRPQSAQIQKDIAQTLLIGNDRQAADVYFSRSVELAPLRFQYYLLASSNAFKIGEQLMRSNNHKAIDWLTKSVTLHQQMQQTAERQPIWPTARERMPQQNSMMVLTAGKALAYTGEYQAALALFSQIEDDPVLGVDAHGWEDIVQAKLNGIGEAEAAWEMGDKQMNKVAWHQLWDEVAPWIGRVTP